MKINSAVKTARYNLILQLAQIAAISLIMVAVSCTHEDPKALAKQSYDLSTQAILAMFDAAKTDELNKKIEAVEKKVKKLPDSERAIYTQELIRLAGAGFGNMLNSAADEIDAALDKVDEVDE
ncbi:MAG: hypothetical protein Ta2B_22500 [Termitinemataceae bacterium]|nr:MAG: hypothetical protein Ta2B_22500 [Termitinemataceae bacterium]